MFPLRVVVETVQEHECTKCSSGGETVADSYAIVSGQTPLSQLVDTVLSALGFQQLAYGAKGLIQMKNWKPLSFDQITENPDSTVDSILKDISNHLTLKILTKQADTAVRDCVSDLKGRLLKAALNRNPQILASLKNQQLKEFVNQLIQGETQAFAVSIEQIEGFNNWLDEVNKGKSSQVPGSPSAAGMGMNGSLGGGPYHSTTTRFNQLLEIPKLQRWFQENPNPTRQKLIQFMHVLNGSNFRRHNNKITYQQICNWFSNARAVQRQEKRPPFSSATEGGAMAQIFSPVNFSVDLNDLIRQQRDNHQLQQESTTGSDDSGIKVDPDSVLKNGGNIKSESGEDEPMPVVVEKAIISDFSVPNTNSTPSPTANLSSPPENQHQGEPLKVAPNNTSGNYGNSSASLCSSMISRSRLMFDPLTELPLLEKWFEDNPHPSWIQIDQFTETLNSMSYRHTYPPVSTHNVKIWFKNRRAKCKRLQGHSEGKI